MEQDQRNPEQKPSVRRRYTPVPPQEQISESIPSPAEAAPVKRRSQRHHSDTSSENPEFAAPVVPVVAYPEQTAKEPSAPPPPEPFVQLADNASAPPAQQPAVSAPLSRYDKRNTAPIPANTDKRPEEKHMRFSDKHLSEEEAAHKHKPVAHKSEKQAKREHHLREKLQKPAKTQEIAEPNRKTGEEPAQQQPILTSQAFDMRLKKQQPQQKKKIFRKVVSAGKNKTIAENKRSEKAKGLSKPPVEAEAKASAEKAAAPQKFQYPSQYTSQKRPAAPVKAETVKAAEAAPASESNGEKPPLRKRLPYYIGIALCSVVLIVSGTMLLRYYSQIWRANNASGQLRDLYKENATASPTAAPLAAETSPQPSLPDEEEEIGPMVEEDIPEATPTTAPMSRADSNEEFLNAWPKKYPGNEQLKIQDRFAPLRHENRDIVGWLTIEGVVDEPVFQRDNSFYLTHDATGAKNPTGALFLDENCNLRNVPMMTLVHGHNMKEGAMFGSLKKYKVKDASYYKEHPFITFDTLYEKATYVIFAVAEVNIVPGNTHYFPFWHQFSFGTKDSFEHFVLLAKEYSRFKVDIDVAPGDRLLTLATCSSDDSNLRLIVMARMLRANEDKIMLSNKIYSATAK